MSYLDYAKFVLQHTVTAVSMALLFVAGAACAFPVMRYGIRPLLAAPRWFAEMLGKVLAAKPSIPYLALFIFSFNGSAIFLYMLTGLVPWLPAVVVFFAGLNVVLAGMLGRQPITADRVAKPLPALVRLCAILTFLLELPSLWYAMAMGWVMEVTVLDLLHGAALDPVRRRVLAYLIVILPLLAVSALAEAYAVTKARE